MGKPQQQAHWVIEDTLSSPPSVVGKAPVPSRGGTFADRRHSKLPDQLNLLIREFGSGRNYLLVLASPRY